MNRTGQLKCEAGHVCVDGLKAKCDQPGEWCGNGTAIPSRCKEMSYSFEVATQDTCKQCPHGAMCCGGSHIVALSGFWSYPGSPADVTRCPHADACLGAPADASCDIATSIKSTCAPKYSGPVCGSCTSG